MNDPRFPVRRVNLVEEKAWKERWDPAGKIGNYASENAYDAFSHMEARDLERYVNDLATYRTKGKKAPRKFSSEEIEWIAKLVEDGDGRVDQTNQAILDALAWMYEAAYLPDKGDIEGAMERAEDNVSKYFDVNLDLWEPVAALQQARRGPKEWSPRKRLEVHEIMRDLLKRVNLEQKEGHYDRYLVFDFRSSQVVRDLLSRSKWAEIDLVYTLKVELQALSDTYVIDFFENLEKIMDDIDIFNRTDWQKSWKAILSSGVAPDAQKEMAAAVKEMPTEAEEDFDA